MSFEYKVLTKEIVKKEVLYEIYDNLKPIGGLNNAVLNENGISIPNYESKEWTEIASITLVNNLLFVSTILNRNERNNLLEIISRSLDKFGYTYKIEED